MDNSQHSTWMMLRLFRIADESQISTPPLREEDCSGMVIVSHEGCHELENIYLLVDVLKGSTMYKRVRAFANRRQKSRF